MQTNRRGFLGTMGVLVNGLVVSPDKLPEPEAMEVSSERTVLRATSITVKNGIVVDVETSEIERPKG